MKCAALCLALLAAPAVAQYSYLCATPANYQGSAMYDPPDSTAMTCDAIMGWSTGTSSTNHLKGKDFSSAFSCSAETFDLKSQVNLLASYCCGTGVSACWVDHSYLCADPSSWTPSTVPNGETATCIQLMDWYTQDGQALEGDAFRAPQLRRRPAPKVQRQDNTLGRPLSITSVSP